MQAEAPPGLVLVIEQATGMCDGSDVRTALFRKSHKDSVGNIKYQAVYAQQLVH